MTHLHDLFYITVKHHDYIPKGIKVTEPTRICIKKHQRGVNSKRNKARALIFVGDTLSLPVCITVNYPPNLSVEGINRHVDPAKPQSA